MSFPLQVSYPGQNNRWPTSPNICQLTSIACAHLSTLISISFCLFEPRRRMSGPSAMNKTVKHGKKCKRCDSVRIRLSYRAQPFDTQHASTETSGSKLQCNDDCCLVPKKSAVVVSGVSLRSRRLLWRDIGADKIMQDGAVCALSRRF